MTAAYAPLAPAVRHRPKRRWRLFKKRSEPIRPEPANDAFGEVPRWLRHEKPGRADVSEIPGRHYPPAPKLSDYQRKPIAEPVKEPQICPVEEAKLQIRRMTWIQLTETAEAFECKPEAMWKWATKEVA